MYRKSCLLHFKAKHFLFSSGKMRERQSILLKKHHNAKSKASSLNVGGGVALWPEMDNMRLMRDETVMLIGVALLLITVTIGFFQIIHGDLQNQLRKHHQIITHFHERHPLQTFSSNSSFHHSIKLWHYGFIHTLVRLRTNFHIW